MKSSGAGTRLLEDAARYALGLVTRVTPPLLSRPTPCAGWDLGTLLGHVNDSVDAVHEGMVTGRISPVSVEEAAHPAGGLVATFRDRVGKLVAAAGDADDQQVIVVGDHLVAGGVVTAVAVIELAVHGWDMARACGCRQPMPSALATGILQVVPLVVTDATRHDLFGAPIIVSPLASPSDRLVALLGRDPTV
jgi:uncharacterized protein (TIGR03086 family)